jgi:hypothetical protein
MLFFLIFMFFAITLSVMLTSVDSDQPHSLWQDGYCVHSLTKTPAMGSNSIEAKIEGQWQSYRLVDFPPAFWDWNKKGRTNYISIFREILEKGKHNSRKAQLSGPHNAVVASHGACRKDTRFGINAAIKGMGFLPKEERLGEMIAILKKSMDYPLAQKLDILEDLYINAEDYFAHDRLASLELYSEPGFETQSFLNQMQNPSCSLVWMDIPTFKIKSIVSLLDPRNPGLSDYEKQGSSYINLIHSYFHGNFPKDYIAAIYFNVEIYDSSPGKLEARGQRIC